LGNKQWDIPTLRELLEKILPEQFSFDNYEVEHDFATIGRRIMLLNARQIERAWGRVILLAIEDITESSRMESGRKQAQKTLKEERLFIENALNSLQDVFFVFDLEGRFLRWNKSLTGVTGYTDEEISQLTPVDLFRGDDINRIAAAIQVVATTGSVKVDALFTTKNEKQISYSFSASLLRGPSGTPMAICGLGRDVTEQKMLVSQLLHAQKMEAIGTLAGGIAHDFNNILNVIMGYGNIVADTLAADSPAKEDMHEVLIAAGRAADLTKRLLLFSRKQAVEVKPININELILGLQKMLARIIRESIEFHLDLTDTPLIVSADTGQVEQVLINLVSNAGDVMLEGGRLQIATRLAKIDAEYVNAYGYGRPGKYALITVADSGQGMDVETQQKIFEPFFHHKGGRKRDRPRPRPFLRSHQTA